ncbi:MAG: SEC-C domain-containing protein [Desulfobacterales bacterium]|nr:SEC-C domain-containing protein [Desulfobacterales bacterium]
MNPCPCNPEKDFAECCYPYLSGAAPAPSAEALMRSRYSAYVNGEFNYLLDTWHPDNRDSAPDFAAQAGIRWQGLEIIAMQAGNPDDTEGMVEFKVKYEAGGRTNFLHEKSTFVKEKGKWFYVSGKTMPCLSTKVGRNEPCPCGSGRKYKKCCMR